MLPANRMDYVDEELKLLLTPPEAIVQFLLLLVENRD
jgi:hypothetical protein